MKKVADILFSPQLMGSLLVLFAVSIGIATFIENDFGSSAARTAIYNSRWFEFLLALLVVNATGTVIRRKIYRKKKLSIFVFHIAFLLILTGAALTRYVGFEGSMHIREGETAGQILSRNIYLKALVKEDNKEGSFLWDTKLSDFNARKFRKALKVNGLRYTFELEEVISNAVETPLADPEGKPLITLILFGKDYQMTLHLKEGETTSFGNVQISYSVPDAPQGIEIIKQDTLLLVRFPVDAFLGSMMDRESEKLERNRYHPLEKRNIYIVNGIQMVLKESFEHAITRWISAPAEIHDFGRNVFLFRINNGSTTGRATIVGNPNGIGEEVRINLGNADIRLSYGRELMDLPFLLRLEDFQLDRYPGSNSPSSFTSHVTLLDPDSNIEKPFRIYMNNILKYKGYRFYQSSYDPDEKGTILSVNHDFMGILVTYAGYFILVAGIVLSLLNRNSRFRVLTRGNPGNVVKTAIAFFGFLIWSLFSGYHIYAQNSGSVIPEDKVITYTHSRKFGEMLVQDRNGRVKPLNTLASDVVRKVTKREKFMGYHPTQILLGMLSDPGTWQNVRMVKVNNPNLAKAIGIDGEYASYLDFIDMERRGEYKISSYVERAYGKPPGNRDKLDKEVILVDERVNICYMIFTGTILDVFPVRGDENNIWYSPDEAYLNVPVEDSLFVKNIFLLYYQSIMESVRSGNWDKTNEYLDGIITFQYRNAGAIIPSGTKVRLEIFYNNFNVFRRLFPFYIVMGIILLAVMIVRIITPGVNIRYPLIAVVLLLAAGFIAHTTGLVLRWYISGHAPWSNGYESMIYVAWATMLAGFIFASKSPVALSMTAILSALTLLVAHFSWMNPEITNLVPVLKSYWLTFHVSVITASYGFLGLGALLGFLNLMLMLMRTEETRERIGIQILNLTRVNEMSLILGLYFLTVGTILGAVWANESWGRYWGWDPKETWSLVTILVYVFIVHMRQIPGFRTNYLFNLCSLLGFGSVLMTYFGVNYYLSGLHSYAQGDPVPVPSFVYYLVSIVFLVAVFSYTKERKFSQMTVKTK